MIKRLLAYSFREMFIIGQYSKHVHVTHSFHELLIFFWLALVDIFIFKFDFSLHRINIVHTQPAFTCSKLTIETLEQGVKYVQS